MKHLTVLCTLTAATLLVSAIPLAFGQQIQVNKDNRTISVTAQGEATQIADAATLRIGYLVYGANSQAAYANASRASNDIAAALAAAGVAKDAIQSEDQSISPVEPFEQKDLPPAVAAQRQFKVQQSWSVKTSAAQASGVLDAAVKAGANNGGQIDWSVADKDALHAKALQDALTRARAQAGTIATGLNAKLGSLVYASNEVPSSPPVPLMAARAGNAPMAMSKVAPLAVSARKVSDSATIYAVFAIE